MEHRDIIIIGAGPAGLAAAMQLQRYGLAPLVLEKTRPGGLLHNANLVENYPGFPGGLSGPELASRLVDHAHSLNVQIVLDEVTLVEPLTSQGNHTLVVTTQCATYQAPAVLVASGTEPNLFTETPLPIKSPNRIHYDVTTLASCQDARIAIIGAGDAAFDYALNLARRNSVHIFNRTAAISALDLLVQRSQVESSITYSDRHQLKHVSMPDDRLNLQFTNGIGSPYEHLCHHLIFAIGRHPALNFLSPFLHPPHRTPGLYWAGDVINGLYRQAVIACGAGLEAAMRIQTYLKELAP